jgi:hypothetical protein
MGDVAAIIQRWIERHPQQWPIVLAALVLAWLLGLGVAYRLSKASRLKKDPLQHELTNLIIQMMVRGTDKRSQNMFIVNSTNSFTKAQVLDRSKQQSRLAHALLMARPALGRAGYERARSIVRRIL